MRSAFFALLTGIGLCLVLASLCVPLFLTGRQNWTNELAQKYQVASQNYHAALHSSAHTHAEDDQAEQPPDNLDAARRDYEQYRDRLAEAQSQGPRTASILLWTGIVLCAVGFAGYLLARQSQSGGSSA